jgi:hypothetical protein
LYLNTHSREYHTDKLTSCANEFTKESLIKLIKFRRRNCVHIFLEVSRNSYSIAAIFGEDMGDFNKSEIIGLDQSFPNNRAIKTPLERNPVLMGHY